MSFERPELSPCLAGLNRGDPKFTEAAAIIAVGGAALARRPRADMPGFVPCEKDLQREEKFAARRADRAAQSPGDPQRSESLR